MEFSQFNKNLKLITPLERPENFGVITIYEVWDNENPGQHFDICQKWAWSTWKSWEKQHTVIEKWAHQFLEDKKYLFI